jgi:hypothetical protein
MDYAIYQVTRRFYDQNWSSGKPGAIVLAGIPKTGTPIAATAWQLEDMSAEQWKWEDEHPNVCPKNIKEEKMGDITHMLVF